jgi:hypothetical protein
VLFKTKTCAVPHLLLQCEQVPGELLLQPLIGVVDAQLLKAVLHKLLEAVNIQDGDTVSMGPFT